VGKSTPPKVDIRDGTYSSAKYGRKGYFKVTSKVIFVPKKKAKLYYNYRYSMGTSNQNTFFSAKKKIKI